MRAPKDAAIAALERKRKVLDSLKSGDAYSAPERAPIDGLAPSAAASPPNARPPRPAVGNARAARGGEGARGGRCSRLVVVAASWATSLGF